MNVIFTLLGYPIKDSDGGLYFDLIQEFNRNGHNVTVIAPFGVGQSEGLYNQNGVRVLRVNTQETGEISNSIKKGRALIQMPTNYKKAYKKYLNKESFDLILMPTPEFTMVKIVSYIQAKNPQAKFYLILRDIHPESSVNIGLLMDHLKDRVMYAYLYKKAQRTYKTADYIGCMSPGNIEFVKKIAPRIDQNRIVLLPNWLSKGEETPSDGLIELRDKLGGTGKIIALFGGTIGIGQGITDIVDLAKVYKNNDKVMFLVVGKGIRKQLLIDLVKENSLSNVKILDSLPRDEYMKIIDISDIGIVALNHNYQVPTCPSKVIAYMVKKKPVFAMINENSDYGQFYIDKPNCGYWTDGKDYEGFNKLVGNTELRKQLGRNGYDYYLNNFTPEKIYNLMVQQIEGK